ncbi:hypothetical protein BO71DRAFT_401839 [Aspergillus ellipticus CBS 707.79]|uniref:Uncharacterized protein n=1 Tax=Aspergillus ellipticus CBS 707.79 TaxID=1448320 RepID=A0A319D8P2_9EURO|nr:hypothetical protein BO71DRAFT_401839 [Aspergillus ellipticus CBS 707.79]
MPHTIDDLATKPPIGLSGRATIASMAYAAFTTANNCTCTVTTRPMRMCPKAAVRVRMLPAGQPGVLVNHGWDKL